ncbi:MAG: Fe(3+) ABC transporter substrate-binding protein [Halieaceae bacterium]|nr:Fe(3+) ABC transporter substrate-binding protein [Halieaceae bacterium]
MRYSPLTAVICITALLLSACDTDGPLTGAGEVNLYSSRHYDTDLALYDNFTEATGITVNLIEAGADELIARIQSEGKASPADILITVDAGRLWRAEQAGIFQSVDSAILSERLPAPLRHPGNLWFGLSKRARVIVYNLAAGLPVPLSDYSDLADPAHRGKVCIRSSSNIYNISLMAGIVARMGEEAAEVWAEGVVENFARPPQSNDTGQIRAVASGECQIAVVNTYYLARLAASDDPADLAVASAVGIIFPGQQANGTHINISGAGVVASSKNKGNAIQFLEYLTSDNAQSLFADGNAEYPAVPGIGASSTVVGLGEFKEETLNAAELGTHQATAVMVFDRVGWQ